jgi:diadenosine tetraphosphate (Ap4A) HIT family hydrolase
VVPARAPYCKDHILIVPKRHVCLLKALTHEEIIQMFQLVEKRDKKLRKYHKNISLLLRDGLSKEKI